MAPMPFPNVHPSLAKALADKGYAEPTPVQAAVLESGAEGRDLLVSAQTGSGKTVAYGLALAPTLMGEDGVLPPPGAPLALIIAPTRELAMQVERELQWLYADARVAVCVGGMDPRREQRVLERGCHIVVATPGRLRDHLERGNFDGSALRAVVLDEADEMLDLGFREDLEFILDSAPADRRTLLFSATIAREIVALARTYQKDAVRIDTVQAEAHSDIEYRAFLIAPNEIEHAVVNVLRFFDARGSIVFCHTREAVRHLHSNLVERGFAAVALSGELSQNERTLALSALRDGRARVLVATDVAARGLDLPDLGLIIHAELPTNRAALLHRSGRTGRAGKKGVSVLLVPYTRRRRAEAVIHAAAVECAWSGPPAADEIRKLDQERLLHDPLLTEETPEEDLVLARALLQGRSAEDIAAALIRLYRARLPSPEELFDGGSHRPDPRERPRDRSDDGAPRGDWTRDQREARVTVSDGVWFRLNIGREKNADPKWLIPLICRRGHVTKPDIGAIRVFGRETKFEITAAAAERFAAAVQTAVDDGVRIEPSTAPAPKERFSGPRRDNADAPRPPRKDFPPRDAQPPEFKPREFKPREFKPREFKAAEFTPGEERPRDFKPKDSKPRDFKSGDSRPRAFQGRDFKPRTDRSPDSKTGDAKPWTPHEPSAAAETLPPRLREDRPREDRAPADRPKGEWAGKPQGFKKPFKKKPGGKPNDGPRKPFKPKRPS
jgi:ATP-dependent RNA helicase DeaD